MASFCFRDSGIYSKRLVKNFGYSQALLSGKAFKVLDVRFVYAEKNRRAGRLFRDFSRRLLLLASGRGDRYGDQYGFYRPKSFIAGLTGGKGRRTPCARRVEGVTASQGALGH
jgi:hypothetical protein